MQKLLTITFFLLTSAVGFADTYQIDTKGSHAFVQFKIKHLGFSWLYGRFDKFDGQFVYDEADPSKSSIEMTVQTGSVNSNHTARDKHLRSDDYLNVDVNPTATFKSKSFTETENGHGTVTGDLTLNGVTKEISLDVAFVGGGKDPWGGFRRGYEASTELTLTDFNIKKAAEGQTVELIISVEGIKQ